MDILLSQTDKRYLYALANYKKSLKQRNTLLKQLLKKRYANLPTDSLLQDLDSWDQQISKYGAEIVSKRQELTAFFAEQLEDHYHEISDTNENVEIKYRASIESPENYLEALQKSREKDINTTKTNSGPHRDDIVFFIDERELSTSASRGEFRTVLLALKLAEIAYIKEKTGKSPVLLIPIIVSVILASVPALIWGYIFYKKNPEDRKLVGLTFTVGALAVFPILIYKFFWQFLPWINAFKFADKYSDDVIGLSAVTFVPLSIIITFMIVGLIEEIMKMLSVKVVDDDEIRSIDDSIEFFIIAALGFSLTENILYFYNIWLTQGPENLILPFFFRSSFSTLAHLIFSGILGYYYGVAHFAGPILRKEIRENRRHWTVLIHKIFNFRKTKMFHQENILEGLLISIGLHALFNIFLEMNWTFVIVPFLVSGYITLDYMFRRKENHKRYGKLLSYIRNH